MQRERFITMASNSDVEVNLGPAPLHSNSRFGLRRRPGGPGGNLKGRDQVAVTALGRYDQFHAHLPVTISGMIMCKWPGHLVLGPIYFLVAGPAATRRLVMIPNLDTSHTTYT